MLTSRDGGLGASTIKIRPIFLFNSKPASSRRSARKGISLSGSRTEADSPTRKKSVPGEKQFLKLVVRGKENMDENKLRAHEKLGGHLVERRDIKLIVGSKKYMSNQVSKKNSRVTEGLAWSRQLDNWN